MKVSAFRNRLQVDTSKLDGITEQLNGGNPVFWNGSAVQFELGLYRGDEIIDDLSNIASITVEIKRLTNKTGAYLMSKTVLKIDFNSALTGELWDAGAEADCHAKFSFPSAESELDLGGIDPGTFWMVITAIRVDGERITLGCATVTVQEDGSTAPSSAVGGSDFRFNLGNAELRFPDDAFHALIGVKVDDQYTLDIQQAASGAIADFNSDSWRTNEGFPELKFDDATWHRINPLILEDGQYVIDVDQAASGSFTQNTDNFRVNNGFGELLFPDATWHRFKTVTLDGQCTLDIEQTPSP